MSRLTAQLHIARARLGLSVEEYRAVLEARTGKRSAADMSEAERATALEGFVALGFQPAARADRPRTQRPAHVRLIYALWGDLQTRGAVVKGARGKPALRAWINRQTGASAPEFLTVEQAGKCAEALKLWIRRVKGGDDAKS
jgi:phage gp16-like protein